MSSYPKYRIGGAEVQTYLLARELARKGWHVAYTTYDWGQPTADLAKDEGIWIYKLRSRPGFSGFLGAWDLIKTMNRIDADIYVQRGGRSSTGIIGLFAKLTGRVFVWFESQKSDCYGDKFVRRTRERRGEKSLPRFAASLALAWLKDRLLLFGINRADLVVVQTKLYQALMKERLGIDSIVLQNAHPVPDSVSSKITLPQVLWMASLKQWKQPELFIRLAKMCQDIECEFVMAGRMTPDQKKAGFIDRVNSLPNLRYLGQIPLEQANQLFGTASVFVNTSKANEGFPNTFVQSWLHRTPVVSLNFDPEGYLTDKEIGFHSGTFDQMVRDVRRLIESPTLREEMGGRARKFAVSKFDIRVAADRLSGIFKELIPS